LIKNNLEQALKYYEDARQVFELTETGRSSKDYGMVLNNIGVVYFNKKEHEQG